MGLIDGINRGLGRMELMEMFGFDKNEVYKFMIAFGHKQKFHAPAVVYEWELESLLYEGKLGEWVQQNCREGRRTLAERKGQKK